MSDKMGLMAFADYVERNIRDYLPEEYRGAAIQCAIVDKPGYYDAAADPMVALSVLKPGANIAPAVYLKKYHEKYLDGEDLGSLLAGIADKSTKTDLPLTKEEVAIFTELVNSSPEKFLTLVRPRLCPKNRVSDTFASTAFLDLAEVYYLSFEEKGITCSIRKAFLSRLGLTADGVAEAARENLRKEDPVLFKINDLLDAITFGTKGMDNLLDEAFFRSEDPKIPVTAMSGRVDIFALTNQGRLYGAAFLADDDLQARLYKAIGAYYVLPSSIHEVLILPQEQTALSMTENELRDMVREVNKTQVADHERLSDNIYVNRGEGLRPVFGEQLRREVKGNRHMRR